ncbi:MAG: hypothetical protein KDA85_17135, partial [Planctomycetaceae bacterium]|nr:hypothetical protein [Planctomycetaceae bacterium]
MEKQFLFVEASNPTWLVYVSLLVLAVYFRFSRVISVRNLDLLMVLLISTASVVAGASRLATEMGPEASDSTAAINAAEDPASKAAALSTSTDNADHTAKAAADPETLPRRASPVDSANDAPRLPAEGTTAQPETADGIPRHGSETTIPDDPGDEAKSPADGTAAEGADVKSTEPEAQLSPLYRWGSIGLLVLSVLLMLRLMFDESLTRRPRLEQNLNHAGLAFLCVPAFVILVVSVFVLEPPGHARKTLEHGRALLQRKSVESEAAENGELPPTPTETLVAAGVAKVAELSENLSENLSGRTRNVVEPDETTIGTTVRILAVVAHSIVVLGLLYIGRRHFSSAPLGVAMSCLYLLLPCTSFHVHQLSHVLPAACLTWAFACYRKPVVAGVLLGLACGTLFFAVFLLPLWAVFYGRRGSVRFGLSLLGVAAVLMGCLILTSSDTDSLVSKLVITTNWTVYQLLDDMTPTAGTPFGHLYFRIPMAAIFFVMLTAMTFLPRTRNLENLL